MRGIPTPAVVLTSPNRLSTFLAGQVHRSENVRPACNGSVIFVQSKTRLHGSVRAKRLRASSSPSRRSCAKSPSRRSSFRAQAHSPQRVLRPSIGSRNSSRRRPVASPSQRAGSVL